ncbi:MAG: DNA polymerase II [Pseudomonadota bacterium]
MSLQTLDGFVLTRSWRDTAEGVELEFWFATDEGPLRALVSGGRSVFFLPQHESEQARALLEGVQGLRIQPLELRDFTQQPVCGLYFFSHREARRGAQLLQSMGLQPLEADINPAERFLMERFVNGSARVQGQVTKSHNHWLMRDARLQPGSFRPRLKVVSFDIETAMSGVQLFSIAVHGFTDGYEERKVFMVGAGAQQDWVESLPDQGAVLDAFVTWLEQFDPDVLIGWNVVNFDARYLQSVADLLGRRLVLGRAGGSCRWREIDDDGDRFAVQLSGRVLLDGIEMLRAAFYRFESFALEVVAQELLGEGKLLKGRGRGAEIADLYRNDKSQLADYNLKDCELVSRIFQQTALLDFAVARSAITGLNLDRMGGSVASFDNLYLPQLHRAGYVAPVASESVQASPGGFVLDSRPGIYDHVLVLDFKSLYPSIIRTFCIDPLGMALGVNGGLAEEDKIPGYLGADFARDGHILPNLIKQLWQQRDQAKSLDDAPLSQAIKIIMNSFYGVLGSPGCRFFDARLASSITLRGHDILGQTRAVIEQLGYKVIYGDTDSVFVWLPDAGSDEEALAAGATLQEVLNAWWREEILREFTLESALELEFETHFQRFLMPTVRGSEKGSKKRYAGLVAGVAGSDLVFKGLESVRSDWTRLARDFQEELYRRVFLQLPYHQYIKEITERVLQGEEDARLVYRKRLRRRLVEYVRNVPPHVQAARLYEQRDIPVPVRGDWIEYVMTTTGPEPASAFLAPLDYQHYVDRQLAPVADGVLGLLGESFRVLTDRQMMLF